MKKAIIIISILWASAFSANAQCNPDRHNSNWFDAWVSCEISENPNEDRGLSHWIMYDLNNLYGLGNIHFWNINDINNLDWGAKIIAIDYSTDGNNWFELGEIDIEMSTGSSIYEGLDIANFENEEARFVLITILENWGGECFGFAEIKFQVTNPVTVKEDTNNQLIIANTYPNPFKDNFNINIQSSENENIYLNLTDVYGRNIFRKKISPDKLINDINIDVKNLPESIYILQIRQGEYVISKRLIKAN